MKAIKKFETKIKGLSQKEKVLLKKLVLAAKLIAPLYLKQKNNKYPGANFYPQDISKKEIERAAGKNPAILNPYTFVEKNRAGKLVAVPFHQKFKRELTRISKILKEAAGLCEDKNFKVYLKERAKDLLSDNYDKSNIAWLKTENSKIGFVIGPFDRYLDKLFFKKRAYMAWVGIFNKEETEKARKLVSLVLKPEKKYLPRSKIAKVPKIRARIEDSLIFSGLIADFMFVGNNLPSSADIYLIKKHGTIFTIFDPTIKRRFEKSILPILKKCFDKKIQKKYSKKELQAAFLRSVILHEICHSLMRYEDATSRLQEYFPFFDELYTDILGIKSCATLLLKDVISSRELEALLLVYICRNLHWAIQYKKDKHLVHYATGGAISLNFLIGEKILKKKNKKLFISDFKKLFISITELSCLLDYYMALGNHKEAKKFIEKHGNFAACEKECLSKVAKLNNRKS